LRHCLDTVNRKVTCENNVPVYQDKRWCVTLNAKGNRLASVESLDKRFFYEVLSEERVEGEWLPKVFRFRMAEGPSMTLRVEKRLTDKIFTGAAILK
jgi:isocitrate dehydrogenase